VFIVCGDATSAALYVALDTFPLTAPYKVSQLFARAVFLQTETFPSHESPKFSTESK
jgi:hypothetical protein